MSDKLDGLQEVVVKREEEEEEEEQKKKKKEEHAERKRKNDDQQIANVKPEVNRIVIKAEINKDAPDDQNLCLTRERIPGKIR